MLGVFSFYREFVLLGGHLGIFQWPLPLTDSGPSYKQDIGSFAWLALGEKKALGTPLTTLALRSDEDRPGGFHGEPCWVG